MLTQKDPDSSQAHIAQLERKVTTLTHLLEVSGVMNSVLLRTDVHIKTLLSYLMDSAADIVDSEGASVLLWSEEKQALNFIATTSDSPVALALIGKPVPLDSIAGSAYKEKRIVTVDNALQDPRHYSQFDRDNKFVTRSLLCIPMVSNKRTIGVLEVVNKRHLPWTQDDQTNLSLLASEAAVAIEVAQLLVDLQAANAELSELDSLKSSFIAIASHELRTPLGIIMGYASFLQEAPDAEVSEHAEKVMSGAIQLRSIIDNMVSLRYLKQKKTDLHYDRITLDTVMNDLKSDICLLPGIEERRFELSHTDGTTELMLDRARIGMAIINVVRNAIAFTQKGGLVKVEAAVRNEHEVCFTITDDGIGLELEQLGRIFEEFYQVEHHMTRRHGGLGIGLSISRALVQAHGGRIWAYSAGLGHGVIMTIALPLQRPGD